MINFLVKHKKVILQISLLILFTVIFVGLSYRYNSPYYFILWAFLCSLIIANAQKFLNIIAFVLALIGTISAFLHSDTIPTIIGVLVFFTLVLILIIDWLKNVTKSFLETFQLIKETDNADVIELVDDEHQSKKAEETIRPTQINTEINYADKIISSEP